MTNMKLLPIYYYLSFFLGSFVLCLVLTPLVRRLAIATGQMAVPKDTRWHKKETALMGGVSIFVSFVTVWILALNFMNWWTSSLPLLPILICALGIFLLGMADDIFNIDPQHKLAGQIIIASLLTFLGFKLGWTNSNTANLFL